MKKYILLIALLPALLAGCGSAKLGVVSNAGVAQYSLCEKAKARTIDVQRISFELPLLFTQAPCGNWPGYSHSLRSDSVSVSLPGMFANESKTGAIGGRPRFWSRVMEFHGRKSVCHVERAFHCQVFQFI